MFAPMARRFVASGRRRIASAGTLIASLLLPFVLALLTSGCGAPPPAPIVGADPSDPGARAPRVDYRSTIGSYKSQRPVEPGPWGEQNQSVAPQPKSPHEGHR
jgi:hypothetical protein